MATGKAQPNDSVQTAALHGRCILGYFFKKRIFSRNDITMGGISKIGAGRNIRVMAVSKRAFLAATVDVPTTAFLLSKTSTPSLSSLFRMRTTLQVLAVATAGNGTNL